MARTHVTRRGDDRAWVVAFRQADSRQRPRFYQSFNDEKYGGKVAAYRAAKLCEAQAMARQARGQSEHAVVTATFEQAANRWHAHGVAKGWRASTASDYRSVLDSRLIREFGHLPLPKLTVQHVEEWLETVRTEISARSIVKLLFVGGAVCERAHREWPGFTGNPFREIERGTKLERRVIEVFTPEEVAAIVRATETPQDAAIILVAANEGVRRGEIPPLQVGDVDFVGRHLHVRRNYVHGVLTTPKGKRERSVPLEQTVAVTLEKLLKARGDPPEDELLFPAEDGGLLDPAYIGAMFRAARDAAGVRKLRLHDLRHTYCSRLAMSGVPLWKIAQFAGHVSTQTTELYAHFAPSAGDADTVDDAFAPTETAEDQRDGSPEDDLVEQLMSRVSRVRLAEALAQVLTQNGE